MLEGETLEAILTRYEDAVARRDAEAVIADYAPNAIGYDLAPPLVQHADTLLSVDGIRDWFDTWEEGPRISHADVRTHQDGDLGVLHCLQCMEGTKKGDKPSTMWFRTTVAALRIEGAWKIVHIHTSVPFAMDGSDRALLDLEPETAG